MDFGALPPEINSERMYAGPGVGTDVGGRGGLGWVWPTDLDSTAALLPRRSSRG